MLEMHVPNTAKLYLDYVLAGPQGDSLDVLTASLEAAPFASVLIRCESGQDYDAEHVRRLIATGQKAGVAVLLDDVARARESGADGVHIGWAPDVVQLFKTARRTADAGMIVGADAGRTRHDAMEIGELNADYVAFGIPAHVEDRARAAERQLDLVAWWSNVFEIPCVAFDVAEAKQARWLAEAGADFIGVTVRSTDARDDVAARIRDYSDAISIREDIA